MPRFVILEHDHPQRHWDLMLETGSVLRTWRLLSPPGPTEGQAEPTFDHRLLYLTYEGPVSGNRGTVKRWDGGDFDWLRDETDRVQVLLHGATLQGTLTLERGEGNWRVTWTPTPVPGTAD